MFERFTDRARRVVVLAQEEARMLQHNYIGTEHLLLGLIHEGDGVACRALESLGISLRAVRQKVEDIIGEGATPPSGHIPFTPRAKSVLEFSLREANALAHRYIGTEHILLGLLRVDEGVASQILMQLGADLPRVRQQVVNLLEGHFVEREAGTAERVEVRLSTASSIHRDPAAFPLCPSCRMSLADSLRFRVLPARDAQGDQIRDALVLYCETCGTTIQATPIQEAG